MRRDERAAAVALVLVLMAAGGDAAGSDRVVVRPDAVLRPVPRGWLGMNVNYFLDDDRNAAAQTGGRPDRPLAEALREMGVTRLRYPGGDKSDSYLWSVPPFDRPRPTTLATGTGSFVRSKPAFFDAAGNWKAVPLDFDGYLALCRAVGAEPDCVVCFDAMFAPAREGYIPPTLVQLRDTAAAWVRYANGTRRAGVTRWELGNESYHGKGDEGLPTAAEYGAAAAEIARAMKAVDPSIRIGLNGPGSWTAVGARDRWLGRTDPWWPTVLAAAGALADDLVCHTYPCWSWGSYDRYRTTTPDLAGEAEAAEGVLRHLTPAQAARYRITFTEINAADWAHDPEPHWPNVNDLGHALVLADLIGQLLRRPSVDTALVWNTRWFDGEDPPSLWNSVNRRNGLNATGEAVRAWSGALRAAAVAVDAPADLPAFACADPGSGETTAVLINKGAAPRPVEVAGGGPAGTATRRVLAGTGPLDPAPGLADRPPVSPRAGVFALTLEPVSLTVLAWRRAP